ncbi:hypothetical protein [Herbaspirillum huttiense]|uniref:Uncharacterized protein n=2 Tax=Herbaspirillum huttiense TaxID=863372 RepID=A0AAJ2HFE8_9BURK|nr:hypothetical protein [Herbaspirillum huttiense]MDR9839020.1 hypothetical protein [Herbaspirillum huttiense]
MINAEQAKTLVLRYLDRSSATEPFAIQSCTLSERSDYWIIRANSEAYVVRGILERCYVGVNAYLVDTVSGEIDRVGSSCSVDDYLQDMYDAAAAGAMYYVLGPAFGKDDKRAIIRLRQKIECSLQQAMKLVSSESSHWLTGRRRTLCLMQAMLLREGIETNIQLWDSALSAEFVNESIWYWDQLKAVLKRAAEK